MKVDAVSIVASALGVDPESVSHATSLMSSAEWDSLAHFRIVLSLEETLGRPLDPVEITTLMDLSSVEDLLNT